jgi:hypothetical protein
MIVDKQSQLWREYVILKWAVERFTTIKHQQAKYNRYLELKFRFRNVK